MKPLEPLKPLQPLQPLQTGGPCACAQAAPLARPEPGSAPLGPKLAALAAGLTAWALAYSSLPALAASLTYSVLGLERGSHLAASVEFFLYDTPKVLLLLALVVYGVGVLRSFFTPARTRRLLAGKRTAVGNALAALLGVATPFCSCSAVPLFIGFLGAGVPLGVTFSFLISAPMVNEIALVLLYELLGWKIAALYAATGLSIAFASGLVIGRLRLEGHLEDWVKNVHASGEAEAPEPSWSERLDAGTTAMRDIVGKVWPWVVAGIAVGAGIHGFAPEGLLASVMGPGAWWSVPVAVLIGIPMYSNAAGIIPVAQALLAKGAALGTVLAFMMAVIALSLPEMVILRKVLRPRLLWTFFGVVGLGIMLVGFLFNAIL